MTFEQLKVLANEKYQARLGKKEAYIDHPQVLSLMEAMCSPIITVSPAPSTPPEQPAEPAPVTDGAVHTTPQG